MRPLLLLLLLAACAREVPDAPPAASFRDRARPIASTTRGGPADLAGEWVVSAAFPGERGFGASLGAGSRIVVTANAAGDVTWAFPSPQGGSAQVTGAMGPTGPGRYAVGAPGAPELWILWVDDDFRTAAVGTPDGSFGWIMDRPGAASPDRTEAARRMLEFNGYDPSRLAGA
jgi:apolipoprotein D and lipocalin family protein